MNYGISKTVNMEYQEAIEKVTERLQEQGFGILTTIDVKETLKKKLDIDFPRYIILGACNPTFAHKALEAEIEIGLLLPCNVIVYENKEKKIVISAIDPEAMISISDNVTLKGIAKEIRSKIEAVIISL